MYRQPKHSMQQHDKKGRELAYCTIQSCTWDNAPRCIIEHLVENDAYHHDSVELVVSSGMSEGEHSSAHVEGERWRKKY